MEIVAKNSYLPSLKELGQMSLTFGLTVLAWIFFRAENIEHAFSYLNEIFSYSLFQFPHFNYGRLTSVILILFFMSLEWFGRENDFAIQGGIESRSVTRYSFYLLIVSLIFWFYGVNQSFIYFQF